MSESLALSTRMVKVDLAFTDADTRSAVELSSEHAVSLVFLVSGAAGLIFEVVWFHRCGLVFGNSVWATGIVLSSFMGGLALGNAVVVRFAHRVLWPLGTYAFLEVIVAVSGVAVTAGLPWLTMVLAPVNRAFVDSPVIVNLVRLVAAFGVLAVPATAMGATLPLLAGALCRWRPGLGRVLGRLYGWNTLGAVAGVLGAELLLIPRFGVMGSAWVAGALNLGVAAAAVWISRHFTEHLASDSRVGRSEERTLTSRIPWRLLTCAFLAGIGLLALEIVWFRFLSMLVVTTTLAASLMLAVVLTGIGLGGLVAAALAKRTPHVESSLSIVAVTIAGAVIASYWTFQFVLADVRAWKWYQLLGFACWLTFPASLLSGVFFTQLGAALKYEVVVEARAVGWLALANTAGAMLGPILAAFLLLPSVGMERSLFLLAMLYCTIGLLGLPHTFRRNRKSISWALRAAAALMLVFFPFGLMSETYFGRAAEQHTNDGSAIVATREGTMETIFLTEQSWQGVPIYHRLVTNGFSMSATAVPGKRYMRQFVYLPMVLRQAPLRRVLVICYGVGVTAGAVRDVATVESIHVVEISSDIVGMSDVIYTPDDHPLRDPRVRLHLEDGRYFLETSADRFDLITGEPPPPRTPGTVNIYTAEYFQLIRDHLLDGGVVTYWLPVARQEGVDHTAIIRAFCEAFEDCSLWNGTPTDLMLMGTRNGTGPSSPVRFSSAWDDPTLGPHLREGGFELPEQMGATFIGDAAYLRRLTADRPPLVDNYPRRLWLSAPGKSPSNLAYLFDRGGVEFYQQVLDPIQARRAFETSTFIKRWWPEPLLERTLPYFEVQRILDRVLIEGANSLGQIEDLHLLLTRTSLQRLPYWILGLGNHPILDRVDTMPNDGTGQVEYVRGLRALVNRDYSGAAAHFAQSIDRGLRGTRPLLVYALCLSGNLDAARTVAQGAEVSNPSQRHFWAWLDTTFDVRP